MRALLCRALMLLLASATGFWLPNDQPPATHEPTNAPPDILTGSLEQHDRRLQATCDSSCDDDSCDYDSSCACDPGDTEYQCTCYEDPGCDGSCNDSCDVAWVSWCDSSCDSSPSCDGCSSGPCDGTSCDVRTCDSSCEVKPPPPSPSPPPPPSPSPPPPRQRGLGDDICDILDQCSAFRANHCTCTPVHAGSGANADCQYRFPNPLSSINLGTRIDFEPCHDSAHVELFIRWRGRWESFGKVGYNHPIEFPIPGLRMNLAWELGAFSGGVSWLLASWTGWRVEPVVSVEMTGSLSNTRVRVMIDVCATGFVKVPWGEEDVTGSLCGDHLPFITQAMPVTLYDQGGISLDSSRCNAVRPMPPPSPSPPPFDAACDNSCGHANDGDCDDGGSGSQYDACPWGTDCNDCGARGCSNDCTASQNGVCDDGGSGSEYDSCAFGSDCYDCGPRVCSHKCVYSNDGDCDDGGIGSDYDLCEFGTDCEDCGSRETCNRIQVNGAENVQPSCMGTFSRLNVQTVDGRFVYQNMNGKFLYFIHGFWMIGDDYQVNMGGVAEFDAQNLACPSLGSDWRPYDGTEWSTSYPITVACTTASPSPPPPLPAHIIAEADACCTSIIVYQHPCTASRPCSSVMPPWMGAYSRSSRRTSDGRFVYGSSSNGGFILMLLEYDQLQVWEIVDNVTQATMAFTADIPMCPQETSTWQTWSGSDWTSATPVAIQCSSPPPLAPPFLARSSSSDTLASQGMEQNIAGSDSPELSTEAVVGIALGAGGVILLLTVLTVYFTCKKRVSTNAPINPPQTANVQMSGGEAVAPVAVGVEVPSVTAQVPTEQASMARMLTNPFPEEPVTPGRGSLLVGQSVSTGGEVGSANVGGTDAPTEQTYTFIKASVETLCGISMVSSEITKKTTISVLAPDGAAADCGLRVGDVLLSINGMRVTSQEQAAMLLRSVEGEIKVCAARLMAESLN